MTIPDAAIEAAAEAIRTNTDLNGFLWDREYARVALEAAMPAIREALADEIESDAGFNEHPWKVGMARARLIVKTGVFR